MNTQQETKTSELQFKVRERAIIYCRVSTDEQAESGTSLDNQEQKSVAYCEANNMQVVGIFRDDITGKILDRPELNKVREMLRAGQADNLIVYKPNRLDRSEWGLNLLILMQELKSLGVSLHYSQDARRVDLHNPMEAFMYGSFAGWQAGEDHRETVRKLHEGRISRAKAGYVVPHGKAPYGYRTYKGDDKKWYFEIVEKEAEIIRLIFHWYIVGDETGQKLSQGKIADRLNEMGIKTKRGGHWKRETVGSTLANETYAGTWHYGKRNARDKRTPTEESIPVPVPAIVERELWEAAKEQRDQNKLIAQRNTKPGRYLLQRRTKCGECGYGMFGVSKQNPNKLYKYYVCRNRHMNKREKLAKCDNSIFYGEITDALVWQEIEKIAGDKNELLKRLEGYHDQQESELEPVKRELELVAGLLKEKEQELDEEMETLKLLTSKRAKARKAVEIDHLESVLDELESRKAGLLSQIEERKITEEQAEGITFYVAQIAQDIETIRQAEKAGQDKPELEFAVWEAKQKLLDVLDVQVILFTVEGKRKAKILAKVYPTDGHTVSIEGGNTCIPKLLKPRAQKVLQNLVTSRFRTPRW